MYLYCIYNMVAVYNMGTMLHICHLPASPSLRVCDQDVECVCATLLRPFWRTLNRYRFPFPGLSFPSLELRHTAVQPPPSPTCNTISPINNSAFTVDNKRTLPRRNRAQSIQSKRLTLKCERFYLCDRARERVKFADV